MRRLPSAVWILLPLGLAVLYALLHGLFAPTPTLENVVPEEAVLTQRFRNKKALDKTWLVTPRGRSRSEEFAENRNLAGLVGVDPMRPFHFVLLEHRDRADPTMAIFPVGDATKLETRFADPSFFLERGHVRHPQHLAIRGDWAAVVGDRDAAQHLGEGGVTARDLGETMALAIDVPRLVDHALIVPWYPMWEGALRALGFEPKPDGEGLAEFEARRVYRVRDAWATARLWTWLDERRVRIELEPSAPDLQKALRAAHAAPPDEAVLPTAPTNAQGWIRVPGGAARAALVHTLFLLGAEVPKGFADPTEGGVLAWAAPVPGKAWTWTLGAGGASAFLDRIRRALPGDGDQIGAGDLSILRSSLLGDRALPSATVVRDKAGDLEVLLVGPTAQDAHRRFATHLRSGDVARAALMATDGAWRPLATFGIRGHRAEALLTKTLEEGGLLQALRGGDIEGTLYTDGRTLRLDARIASTE